MNKRTFLAIATGLAVFAAVFCIKILLCHLAPAMPAFCRQLLLEVLMAISAWLIATKIFKIPAGWFSFRAGFSVRAALFYYCSALLLGMLLSACSLAFKIPPIPLLKELSVPQFLAIMLAASVSEELLSRGLVQGIAKDAPALYKVGRYSISAGVLAGAVVFSLIHLSIYITGGSPVTCAIVMVFALLMGLVAGKARQQWGMGAAIVTHIAFNIGGIAAGVLINVGSLLITGHMIKV